MYAIRSRETIRPRRTEPKDIRTGWWAFAVDTDLGQTGAMDGSPGPNPVPPQRIGDAERDQAAERLRENLALGRLDQTEFDERLETALQARYAGDLTPLFVDLPDTESGQLAPTPSAATPTREQHQGLLSPRARAAIEAMSWVVWPIMIGLITLAGWGNFWWLIFVPIGLSTAWRAYRQHDENEGQDKSDPENSPQISDDPKKAIDGDGPSADESGRH